ncbi:MULTISPECIES: DNA-binding domain-containing protein [unclassified Caballeronia]|uniref:HvfC/BufC N-terminal domain-containing protein n=1 Tax=unclassified Caballeronia TaxID=2646786 RepID=UPI00025BCB5A|nr:MULTISPECIES: DNA-binding domain-containing protein [unclassified Caballeronia]EKS70317.1 hypothetical protein BURK_019625 [Burkholderia sp. SJ98]MCE4546412.1 DNA-binding domain-containing protein [Caballeronia sp. PC1]MCE4573114.1 DNA-binding domain-containing protein [Caballeronia sp. CLC5]
MNFEPQSAQPYAQQFARGLINPAFETPEGLVVPFGNDVDMRYNIYRNNVAVSLIEALAAVFPAVQRITGNEFFRAMARFHLRATPPKSPLLFEYGQDFPDFIESYEYARFMPWLADVARIERAWLDAYHAEDLPVLETHAFASVEAAALTSLRFIRHPASHIVRSSFSAVSIFAMNRSDEPITHLDASEPEDALITRPDFDVTVTRLPPGGATFISQLFNGESLGDSVAAALNDSPAFDLPANLNGVISAGAFTAMRIGDHT